MAETKTILVAGATGQQGGTVARSLLKRGHRVIGLTRSASKLKGLAAAGIEGVQGDLTQRASLTPLVRNVDGFFVVTTPFEPDFSVHPEKEVLQGTTAIDAAKAASMRHVVLSSVASADRNTGIPHFESKAKVEQYLRASRGPNTIVRPVAFMGDDGFRMFQFFKTVGYHVDIPALEATWGYRMTRFHEFLDAVDWQRLGSGQWPTAP